MRIIGLQLACAMVLGLSMGGLAGAQQRSPAEEVSSMTPEEEEAYRLFIRATELQSEDRIAEALVAAEQARRIFERVERTSNPSGIDRFNATEFVAQLQNTLGRRTEAIRLLRAAVDESLRTRGTNHPGSIYMSRSLARLYRDGGMIDEAEAVLRRALGQGPARLRRQEREHLVQDLRELDRERRRPTADDEYRYYLSIVEGCERLPMGSPFDCMRNLTNFSRDGGGFESAEKVLRRFVEESERVIGFEEPETLIPTMDLTDFLLGQGRYAEAEPLAFRVAETVQRVFGRDSDGNIRAIRNLAALHYYQGREAEAEPLFRRVIEDQRRIEGYVDPAELGNLGLLYLTQGRYEEAEPLLREAIEGVERQVVLGGERSLEARNRANNLLTLRGHLALVQENLGRAQEAESLYRASLSESEQLLGATAPRTLDLLSEFGGLLAEQERYGEAIPLLQRALAGAETVLRLQHPETLKSAASLLIALESSASSDPQIMPIASRFLDSLYERRRAAGTGLEASVQRQRDSAADAERFALYADAAWRAVASGRAPRAELLARAFGALQTSIAGAADRSIAEQAARGYASRRGAALAELILERQRLLDEWALLNDDLTYAFADAAVDDEGSPTAIRSRIEAVRGRVDAIDSRLRAEAPDYFALTEPSAVDPAAAQALLAADEAILLVVPSLFGTHVVAVTRDSLDWRRSDWDVERVAAAVRRLRWDAGARVSGSNEALAELQAGRPEDAPPIFDRATAHQLYGELIAPSLSSLTGKTRLFIAAGGPLAGLPFSLLVSAPPPAGADDDPASLRATRWFADDIELTHIPSIQSLAILRAQQSGGTTDRFVGVGNPRLAEVTEQRGYRRTRGGPSASRLFARGRTRNGSPADLASLRVLASLPGTAVELRQVRQALGAQETSIIEGDNATEPAVRNLNFRRARLVLFSTHGLTSEEALGAGEPGLVLTPPPPREDVTDEYLATDPANDGYLAASEVTTLRMDDADWVVLSACNTATGDDNANLSALARAFFYAGARNLLASHWPVSDEVAPLLITRTVAPVQPGLTRGAALMRAMRSIREDPAHPEWAHPFYWAPFVLIGDGAR